MAYAAIASLAETINLILNHHQHSISPKFKTYITALHTHIIFLRSFVEDSTDEANILEERITNLANAAEDIIELILSDTLQDRPKFWFNRRSNWKYELRHDFEELGRIGNAIASIARGVRERHRESDGCFNDDLIQIISRLRGGSILQEIVAIVGIGGIGKTTLAKNVYNHPFVVDHFESRGWATVSQNYSWRGIISGLFSSMNILNDEIISDLEDGLILKLQEFLRGRRYLIVLDDIWSQEVWDKLKLSFPENGNGSRIILTTRCLDVASRGPRGYIHNMRFMNVDQRWSLLLQKIFRGDPCPPKLEYIGKTIARICRGIPLAVEVVSGVLAADKTEVAWEEIAMKVKNAINVEDDKHVLHILNLSYSYLPHHLRTCLMYLGIFPEDGEIRLSKLSKLWVAEGFLNESLEETAEEYLEDLVGRSLVSVIKRKSNGRIKSFCIHDLIRDFCISEARLENFLLHVRSFILPSKALTFQRRVSISDYNLDFFTNVYGSTIRTLICLEGNGGGSRLWLGCFRLLRILDLLNAYFINKYNLPDQIFELFHLRYLAFDFQFSISEAISKLKNLQILIIRPRKYGGKFVKLPVEIWSLPQLRHLNGAYRVVPCQYEEEASALENLQTLTQVVDFICSRETMEMIPNLKKLGIFYTVGRDMREDYELHNLIYLQNLEILKIETHNFLKEQDGISSAFPPTLKKLNLCGVQLPWEDMKIVSSLPNLEVLKIRRQAFVGETWETNQGGFCQLKYLLMEGLDLEHWITESTHFPRLECLLLHHCWRIKEVPNNFAGIQSLKLIAVDRFNEFLVDWSVRMQEDRQSLGYQSFKVHFMRR